MPKEKIELTKQELDVSGKAKSVGLYGIYEFVFRTSSHFVHGSWHDLDFNNLEKKKDKRGVRLPNLNYMNPIPQLLETGPVLVLRVIQEYLSNILENNDETEKLKNYLEKISKWFFEMSDEHEKFLAIKNK